MTASSATNAQLCAAIAAERQDLAQLLGELPISSWDTQTLCAGWRVRELVAHMTMPFRYSRSRFVAEMIKSGGNFTRMADRCAREDATLGPAELVSSMTNNATFAWKPPGGGFEGALIHDVIHGLDFTVALGIDRRVPEDRVRILLDGITRPKSLKHFGADLRGVDLRATDIDWTFGTGTPVFGTAQDLALILCGRKLPAKNRSA